MWNFLYVILLICSLAQSAEPLSSDISVISMDDDTKTSYYLRLEEMKKKAKTDFLYTDFEELLNFLKSYMNNDILKKYILIEYLDFLSTTEKISEQTQNPELMENYIIGLICYALLSSENDVMQSALEKASKIREKYPLFAEAFLSLNEYIDHFRDLLPRSLSTLYKENLPQFSKLIFSDIPGTDTKRDPIPYSQPSFKNVIYNQTGYIDPSTLPIQDETFQLGNTLYLDNNTPIGYNIHLPKGDVKAVFVEVYGGNGFTYTPGNLDNLQIYLLNHGIAIITLNLLDLRELNLMQQEMPSDIHQRLHASINHFYNTLNNEKDLNQLLPENASPELTDSLLSLKDKKKYLYGASFGGRTAVRQAELYPKTFDGYISHDGGLSPGMSVLSADPAVVEMELDEPVVKAREWLSPMTEDPSSDTKIDKIQSPILLLHNFDDNSVNVKVSLHWYQKALKMGKGDLVRFFITRRGNPTLFPSHRKGHFLPEDTEAFKSYSETVASFILNGPSQLPATSEWMANQINIYANKNYRSADLQERFISEAFRLYKYDQDKRYKASVEASNQQNLPALSQQEKYQTSSDEEMRTQTQQEKATQKSYLEQAWITDYRPIYYTLTHLEDLKAPQGLAEEMYRLQSEGLLTDDVLRNALDKQMPFFLEFLEEKYPGKYNFNYPLNSESEMNILIQQLRNWILNIRQEEPDFVRYLLYTLYISNPNLVPNMPPEDTPEALEAKTNLFDKINEDEQNVKAVWRQAFKAIKRKLKNP